MKYTVYQTTHIESNRIYIGVHRTNNPNDSYLGSGKHLRLAIEKYGVDAFRKEVLFVFDNETDMLEKEREIVTEEFCRRSDTFNLRVGADGYENSGFSYINENGLNNKSNQYLKGSKRHQQLFETDPDYRKAWFDSLSNRDIGLGMTGQKHSQETRQKMSNAHTGKNNSQFGTYWITNGIDTKKIKNTDPLPAGWKRGRSTNCTE